MSATLLLKRAPTHFGCLLVQRKRSLWEQAVRDCEGPVEESASTHGSHEACCALLEVLSSKAGRRGGGEARLRAGRVEVQQAQGAPKCCTRGVVVYNKSHRFWSST